MRIFELVVLIVVTIVILISFCTWIWKLTKYFRGIPFSKRDYLGLYQVPITIVEEIIAVGVVMYFNISPVHLIYIFPLVFYILGTASAYFISQFLNLKRDVYIRSHMDADNNLS